MPSQKILNINEAARILRVSEKTLRRWGENEILVPIRTQGGHRRYTLDQIQYFKKNKSKIKKLVQKKSSIGFEMSPISDVSYHPDFKAPVKIDSSITDNSKTDIKKDLSTAYSVIPATSRKLFKLFVIILVSLGVVSLISYLPQKYAENTKLEHAVKKVIGVLGIQEKKETDSIAQLKKTIEKESLETQ